MIGRNHGGRGIHSPGSGPCPCCYCLRTSSPRRSATRLPTPSQPEPPPRGSAGHRVRESRYFFFAFFAAFFFAAMLVLTPLLYQGQATLTGVTSSSSPSLPSSSLPCLFSPPSASSAPQSAVPTKGQAGDSSHERSSRAFRLRSVRLSMPLLPHIGESGSPVPP